LVASKLVDYTLGLYASRAYGEKHGLPANPSELRRHRLIGYVPDLIVSPSLDYGPEIMPDWQADFAVSSALGQVEAVRSGAGIGILHTFIARQHGDLISVEAAPPIRRAYWLVYHESVRPLRRVQAVSAFIANAVDAERNAFV
jgi:DNA-binding transcriptional LysR family regulator